MTLPPLNPHQLSDIVENTDTSHHDVVSLGGRGINKKRKTVAQLSSRRGKGRKNKPTSKNLNRNIGVVDERTFKKKQHLRQILAKRQREAEPAQ